MWPATGVPFDRLLQRIDEAEVVKRSNANRNALAARLRHVKLRWIRIEWRVLS
jgi:hypothetical protein